MTIQVFIPKQDVRVPYTAADGTRKIVPAEGMRVEEPMQYWHRRVADGDGVLELREMTETETGTETESESETETE